MQEQTERENQLLRIQIKFKDEKLEKMEEMGQILTRRKKELITIIRDNNNKSSKQSET